VSVRAALRQSAAAAAPFIHSFCSPDAFDSVFEGDLRGWTPCFIDVAVLGACVPACVRRPASARGSWVACGNVAAALRSPVTQARSYDTPVC
jgi:hypothetical protein